MEIEELNKLIDKYLEGVATQEEQDQLDAWYFRESNKEHRWTSNDPNEETRVKLKMLLKIKEHIYPKPKVYSINVWKYVAVASILLICSLGFYYRFFSKVALSGQVSVASKQFENRFLILPDSSTVILGPGAKLSYTFTDDRREVELVGKGYFDVVSNKQRPFVVSTGDVSTHVVGTSFSIQAYNKEEVVVAVHTGLVEVINKNKDLLVQLQPDEQFQYSNKSKGVTRHTRMSKDKVDWIHNDMKFMEMPFDRVIASLNRRYQSHIELQNPNLKSCLITGAFDGTEDLKTVLDILATTTGTSYKQVGETVLFQGKGCNLKEIN